jgi:hypothetical protein
VFERSRRRDWLRCAGSLLRVVIVVFVAVLASGIVHAHQREAVACDELEDCSHHEDGTTSDCPEEWCGPSHHCGCCSPLVVTCTNTAKVVPAVVGDIERRQTATSLPSSGVRTRVERPPRG